MPTELKTKVARTAKGLSHVNRLVVPGFGIVELHLKNADESKQSKAYLPQGFSAPSGGTDDFHFAPEKETIKICYEIKDSNGVISKAKLELFRRFKEQPIWSLDLTKLGEDWYEDGKHEIEWDGRLPTQPTLKQGSLRGQNPIKHKLTTYDAPVNTSSEFPDGYLTVEHPPYKLRLTVASEKTRGKPATAWTFFHVLVKKIEFELGGKDSLKENRDKIIYDHTHPDSLPGKIPQPGQTKKIFLVSNLFKTSSGEMNGNIAFTEYKNLWGDGPNIPIFAKIWIRDSKDKEVEAPKALGKVKFLWDVEEVDEKDKSQYGGFQPVAKTFIDNAVNYYKDNKHAYNLDALGKAQQPKGENCHKDRGGRRGDIAKAFFPIQPGYSPKDTLKAGKFPFKVEKCETRKWAAYSYAWTEGALANKTGVLFQPSRMAGDAYKVSIYLAYDKAPDPQNPAKEKYKLDIADDAPLPLEASIKKATGIFEIWREIYLIKVIKKKNSTPDLNIGAIQGNLKPAYVELVDKRANPSVILQKASFNTAVQTYVNSLQDWQQLAFNSTVDQYDVGGAVLHCLNFAQFKQAVFNNYAWADMAECETFLTNQGIADSSAYKTILKNWGKKVATQIAGNNLDAAAGITIIIFEGVHNVNATLNGSAIDVSGAGRNRCAYLQCGNSYGGNANSADQTATHEIGHHLFMPHAPFPSGSPPAGSQVDMHDSADQYCMMSYNYGQVRRWCGFCMLRLRGWDKTPLNKTAANNKKP